MIQPPICKIQLFWTLLLSRNDARTQANVRYFHHIVPRRPSFEQASSVLGNPDNNIVEDAAGSVEDDGVWGNVDNNDGGGLPAASNRTISGNRFPYVVSIRRFGQHLCTGTIVDATTHHRRRDDDLDFGRLPAV